MQVIREFLCTPQYGCGIVIWSFIRINVSGSARAAELNAVYVDIVKNYSGTFKNFDIAYMDFPLPTVIKIWTSKGGKVADLIEPIDGNQK